MRKSCSSDREKLLKFKAEGKIFEITRTIYPNSERSEQFLVTELFFNLFLEVSNKLERLEFKLEKIIRIYKHAGKVRKTFFASKKFCKHK